MHYPFGPGLIKAPPQYAAGLNPAGGISARDRTWVKTFYPPLSGSDHLTLEPLRSQPLSLQPGEQANYVIDPPATRMYEIRTFGASDTVIVLFENQNGTLRYLRGDDDSGEDRNAYLKVKLFKGRKYVLRVRLYYADRAGDTAVMVW